MTEWLTARAPAAAAADDHRRLITGIVVPYGRLGYTSAGPLQVRAGAVRIPAELRRVKLLAGHDRSSAIAYAIAATETPDGLTMTFRVAPTPAGDLALVEAAHGTRDAFSVELDDMRLEGDTVVDCELTAVALLAVPAFFDARVASVAAQREDTMPTPAPREVNVTVGPNAPQPPDPDEVETDDVDDEETDDDETEEQAPTSVQAGRRPAGLPATRGGGRRGPAMTFGRAMDQLRRTVADRGPAALVAALSDITPANDAGGGFLRPQWLDEIWTPIAARRDFINSVQHQTLNSGLKVYGWKWATLPKVGPYAGNKAAIPSNTASTEPAEAPVVRYAGGWDVDRIYVDLGDPGFLEAFFRAAVADLGNQQESGMADALLAEATPGSTGGEPDLWAQVDLAARMLMEQGARLTYAGISTDLWAEYVSGTAMTVPWWVAKGNAPSLSDSTGTAADFRFFANADLPPGTVLAGDRQAVTFYETPTIRVQAVNIPNGGVDLAVFSYQATMVNDARGLVAVTNTGAVAAKASSSK